MTGVRGVLRVLGAAGLSVTVGVATNQVLNDGKLSWTWMYAAFGVAVLSLLFSERAVPAPADGPARGGRRVYLRQLRASVRNMETVGIATQSEFVFRMRQVYVDVSVVPQPLHNAAREPYLGSVSGGERRSLESVLRDAEREQASRVLAVIGGPGSGKTTLARNTALQLCEHRWRPWKRRLPVLLYLRDHATDLLTEEPPTLATVAVSAGWLEGKVPARWLARRLDRGGCLVLLDGLDEVADPADRDRVVAWVSRQIQRHPHNTYVVTSRPHGYESNPLPGAEVLQVRRFTWRQIERFLRQWSFATESRARQGSRHEIRAAADRNADDLLTRLRKQAALYDLAANPLLLTMTANVHRYRGQLPGSRAELYAEMCDVLLHRRSEARGLRDATGLTGPHKQHVVQHLALAMMKARVRDWTVPEAARAIRRALRQVPGSVAAEVFLEEARKSGLLVEREHGVYGFAHLTLQEYLAAAQLSTPRADTTVLTANVEDPWWRETILLWSASNDATPVITACLERGTVPALALAFDCGDQARTVDPETRERLDGLLTPGAGALLWAPDRLRLLVGILATRSLRETIQLNDTTALCARPVSLNVYAAFVHDERNADLHHPEPEGATGADENLIAMLGMQAGDAERFVDWLIGVTGDVGYRLPTPEELHDPAAAMAAELSHHTVWARTDTDTVLHRPPGAPWPYRPDPEQLRSVAVADRRQLMPFLRLLEAPTVYRTRIEHSTRVLTTAFRHAPEIGHSPELAPLELPLALAVAYSVNDARQRVQGHGFSTDLDAGTHRALTLVLRLALILDPADSLGDAVIPVLSEVLQLGRIPASFQAHSRNQALNHLFEGVLDEAYDHALTRIRGLDPGFVIDRDLSHALIREFHLTSGSALALAESLDGPLELGLEGAPSLGTVFSDLSDYLGIAPALDLTLSLTDDPSTEGVSLASTAFRLLSDTWRLTGGSAADRRSFDDFLTLTATEPLAGPLPEPPADPAAEVLRIRRRFSGATHDLGHDDTTNRALALLDDTVWLLVSMRNRTSPSSPRTLACARTALLATMAALQRGAWPDDTTVPQLHAVWQSLAALDDPTPNQILLLARTQP